MKKKVGIIKRIFSLLLVFLFSINSFAAVVSDNDGSAFITKAEFDSLKNSFQSQIDQYNTSIDSKVDGAIAAYLAGIRVATEIELQSFIELYSIPGTEKNDAGVITKSIIGWYSGQNNKGFVCHGNQHQYPTWYTGLIASVSSSSAGTAGTANGFAFMDHPDEKATRRVFVNDSGIATKVQNFGLTITGLWGNFSTSSFTYTEGGTKTNSTFGIRAQMNEGTTVRAGNSGTGIYTNPTPSASNHWTQRQDITFSWFRDYTNAAYEDSYMVLQPLNQAVEYTVYETPELSNLQWASGYSTSLDYGWKVEPSPATFKEATDTRLNPYNMFCSYTGCRWSDMRGYAMKNLGPGEYEKDLIWQPLRDICEKNISASYGVALSKADAAGPVNIDFKITAPGYVILWNAPSLPDKLWGGNRTSETDTITWKIDSNWYPAGDNVINLTGVNAGDYIWLIYLPTDTSKNLGFSGKFTSNSIKQTRE